MRPPRRKAQELAVQQAPPIPQGPPAHPIDYSRIYETNLKVIQRRVPNVVAYFDTFSHVAVFRKVTNPDLSKSWEKGGEGPFFLIERSCYPPYAFYVMNRSHNGDLLHLVYPEDEVKDNDSRTDFTVYQAYPEYTQNRLANLPSGLDRFSPEYSVNPLPAQQKGEPMLFGLWWKPTGTRDSIDVVLRRMIQSTREGQPYPEEYRCAPDKPPELRDILDHGSAFNVMAKHFSESRLKETRKKNAIKKGQNLCRDQESPLSTIGEQTSTSVESIVANNTSNAVDALFAGLKTNPPPPTSPSQSSSAATVTGIPLLDSIFASAASSDTPTPRPLRTPGSDSSSESVDSSSSDDSTNLVPYKVYNLTSDILQGLISGAIPLQSEAIRDPDSSSGSSISSYSHPRTGGTGRSREADDESSGISIHEFSSTSETSTVLDSAPPSDLDEGPGVDVTPRANGDSRALPLPNGVPPMQTPREISLASFSDDSELWPYAPTTNGLKTDNEIPEFDFSDTRHLDSLTSGCTPTKNSPIVLVNGSARHVNGYSSSHSRGNSGIDSPSKGSRKNNRDRKDLQQKEIEQHATVNPVTATPMALLPTGSQSVSQSESSTVVTPRAEPAPMDPDQARQAILDALNGRLGGGNSTLGAGSPRIPKNHFVRDILTLIHTDRSFVDSLWNGYYASS